MNEVYGFLNEVLGFAQAQPPLQEIIFALGLSFLLNLLIANVYKATFRGSEFSQDYVHSMLILGTVVSVIVMVVRVDKEHSQATAFGIFAAFSIIRFRTSVSAARDIGFLFVAMSAGLGVGARAYGLATATTILICALIYIFSRMDAFAPSRASHRLRIRVTNDVDYDQAFRMCFDKYLHEYDLVSVESIQAGMMTELRYNVTLRDTNKPGEFVAAIQQLNGNNRVLLTSTSPNRALAVD
ncbi:DUF4956 domain-containing protein [Verrucomicrobiota bacterium sgz303538]